jgi:hypothetical protein
MGAGGFLAVEDRVGKIGVHWSSPLSGTLPERSCYAKCIAAFFSRAR